MDAVEYLKARTRMTKAGKRNPHFDVCGISCNECPLYEGNSGLEVDCQNLESFYPEKAVEIVEKWVAEHPKKTRQPEFLKIFPNAQLQPDGMLNFDLKPCDIDPEHADKICDQYSDCQDCQREYWSEEVR